MNSLPHAILRPVEASARGELPFGLRGEALARPGRVCLGVLVGDVHHRMIVEPLYRGAWSVGLSPVRAEPEIPPLRPVGQRNRVGRWAKDQRARLQHVRQGSSIVLGLGCDLGERDVARRLDEMPELTVLHRRAFDPERIDGDAVHGRFLGIMTVGPHAEGAALDADHVRAEGLISRRNGTLGK